MPRVLISDELSPNATEIFESRGLKVDRKIGLTPEQLLSEIEDYDGLAIRSATKVTSEVISKAKNLKVVGLSLIHI